MGERKANRKAEPTAADRRAAERLKAIWLAKKGALELTQEKLAAQFGISQPAVGQYLNGEIPLNYLTLVKFCATLQCDPREVREDLPEQQWQLRLPARFETEFDENLMHLAAAAAAEFSNGSPVQVADATVLIYKTYAGKEIRPKKPAILRLVRSVTG